MSYFKALHFKNHLYGLHISWEQASDLGHWQSSFQQDQGRDCTSLGSGMVKERKAFSFAFMWALRRDFCTCFTAMESHRRNRWGRGTCRGLVDLPFHSRVWELLWRKDPRSNRLAVKDCNGKSKSAPLTEGMNSFPYPSALRAEIKVCPLKLSRSLTFKSKQSCVIWLSGLHCTCGVCLIFSDWRNAGDKVHANKNSLKKNAGDNTQLYLVASCFQMFFKSCLCLTGK